MTPAALNRATLARQLLLSRAPLDPMAAVAKLVGLQAQEPASPYVALWTRLAGFDPARLDAAIADRELVKGTIMRTTLHLVAATDHPTFWLAHEPTLRSTRLQATGLAALGVDDARVSAVAERALAHADRPRTNAEMTAHLADDVLDGVPGGRDWWWVLRGMVAFVHAPEPGAPWSFGRRPAHVAARSWLEADPTGQPVSPAAAPDADNSLDALVLRYLAGFGPATVGDVAQFTRIERGRVRASVARLAPRLDHLVDTAGRALVDLPGAPRPDAETPAPVRFLPMWDSVLLAYEDRSRLVPPALRARIIRNNGDVLATFLVDGLVAGVWRAEGDSAATRVRWHAFGRLPRGVRAELDAEADSLAAFLAPREPEVYRRYRRWWDDATAPLSISTPPTRLHSSATPGRGADATRGPEPCPGT